MSTYNKSLFNSNIMMERFLQDVHLYHPQNYHDTRPTYDDIPEVTLHSSFPQNGSPALPQAQGKQPAPSKRGMLVINSEKNSETCNINSLAFIYNSKKVALKPPHNENLEKGQSSTEGKPQQRYINCNNSVDTLPQSSPCVTLNYSSQLNVKTFSCSETLQPVLSLRSKKNKMSEKNEGSGATVTTRPLKGLQKRPFTSPGSCYNLTSGVGHGIQSDMKSQGKVDDALRNHVVDNHLKNGKLHKDTEANQLRDKGVCLCGGYKCIVETIEEVVWKHCYGNSYKKSTGNDESSVSSLNIHTIIGKSEDSSLSFDWDVPVNSEDNPSKSVLKNLDVLTETNVNLDEDYKSKLKCVLDVCPDKETDDVKVESEDKIIPALPHVPPSFVGKTWSQINYEDDLKIEALVRQFRKGKFHCYFESGALADVDRKKKRRLKSEEIERKIGLQSNDYKEPDNDRMLPVFSDMPCPDNDSEILSVKSEKILRREFKPGRRTWRLASRCQIVKVSHGTQTSLVNYPVVKKKVIKTEPGLDSGQCFINGFKEERTPDMKTRMCALKLPESYTKILSPLQPKTMVYVLSHPDAKLGNGKPACISRRGRNQFSTDSRDSVNYTYKQSPLKYYDALTNRIIKTPPRSSVRGLGIKSPCVRKLFRSLSSDVNVDKLQFELKGSASSKKSSSSCSFGSECLNSTKGKDLNFSHQANGSSITTECLDHLDKPNANFSVSSYNPSHSKSQDDTHFTQSTSRSRKKDTGEEPNGLCKRKNTKPPPKNMNPVKEPKCCKRSRRNLRKKKGTAGQIAQGKVSNTRTQSLKNPSMKFLKSAVPFVQAHQQRLRKRKTCQRNEVSGQQHVNTHEQSQYISLKPSKKKSSICKPLLRNSAQSRSFDQPYKNTRGRNIIRTRSKAAKSFSPESLPHKMGKAGLKVQSTLTTADNNITSRKRVR
ncbi:DBF4-type zinc finger-containing protein 2 [Spea bombifrons]|uniref:DBF4-type zinc finger-containing protein 2 n=1 Tax=Spea bombifrons TaxID=233779 RepID=UPI00234BAE7E|nr:DBF4-type zinc finger-containing protein 2 [Spea bombifrons]